MTKRILLGGVVGGVVMFIWGAVSHMVLPLGEVGIKQIPNEAAAIAAMRDNIKEAGFYFFPGEEHTPGMTEEQQQAAMKRWEDKFRQGPTGILIYQPGGQEPLSPGQLLTELTSNIAAALVAAFLLWQASGLGGFGGRVLFVTLLGLVSSLAIDVSYWNWYGFPTSFTLATMADQVIGFLLVGLVLAKMVKPPQA
jgi:hypothetical protein